MMYTSWEGKEEVGGEWEGGMGGEWEGGKKEGSGRKAGRKEGVEGRGKEGRKEGVGGEGKGTLWSRGKRFLFNDRIHVLYLKFTLDGSHKV